MINFSTPAIAILKPLVELEHKLDPVHTGVRWQLISNLCKEHNIDINAMLRSVTTMTNPNNEGTFVGPFRVEQIGIDEVKVRASSAIAPIPCYFGHSNGDWTYLGAISEFHFDSIPDHVMLLLHPFSVHDLNLAKDCLNIEFDVTDSIEDGITGVVLF